MYPMFTINIHYKKIEQITMKRESTAFIMIVCIKLKIRLLIINLIS